MHLSTAAALLAVAGSASAAAILPDFAQALPLSAFNTTRFMGLTLEQIQALPNPAPPAPAPKHETLVATAAATCTNPRIRYEWDSLSDGDRQLFVNALLCLRSKPASKQFPQAKNRYEDLVALHQSLTDNVHNNAKFLVWHRYFLWTFEDILRVECGYANTVPWFDETRYAGHFSSSSIFSSKYFGGLGLGGKCVTDGQFKNTNLNVGPGPGNTVHCLSRNGQASLTANCNSGVVNGCNQQADYAAMASCAEGGAHAWGHNGIGAVMQDVYASPGDPVFWLHHAFIDRNFRLWQNADSSRLSYIDGTDHGGNTLTLSTGISVNGLRPGVTIGSILNTMGGTLCYRYNY